MTKDAELAELCRGGYAMIFISGEDALSLPTNYGLCSDRVSFECTGDKMLRASAEEVTDIKQ